MIQDLRISSPMLPGVICSALHALQITPGNIGDEILKSWIILFDKLDQYFPPLLPGPHQYQDQHTQGNREPAAMNEFDRTRNQQQAVEQDKAAGGGRSYPKRVFPAVTNHEECEYSSNQHCPRHRNAIGSSQ